jgi:hypothetical protein
MKKHSLLFFSFLMLLTVALAGCVTTNEAKTQGVTMKVPVAGNGIVSVSLLTKADVRTIYGYDPAADPFVLSGGVILRNTTDYVLLRLTFESTASLSVEVVQTEAVNEKGVAKVVAFTKESFTEEADSLSHQIQNQGPRHSAIQWNYLPGYRFSVDKGTHSYMVVLGGDHPFPDSLTIQVRLLVNGEPVSVDIPLPDGFAS